MRSFSFLLVQKTTLIDKEHGRGGGCRVWSEVHCAELLLGCFGVFGRFSSFLFFSFSPLQVITATKLKKIAICCGRKGSFEKRNFFQARQTKRYGNDASPWCSLELLMSFEGGTVRST